MRTENEKQIINYIMENNEFNIEHLSILFPNAHFEEISNAIEEVQELCF